MGCCSNALLAIINVITFLISIPLLALGIWLATNGATECEKSYQTPIIILGSVIMITSLIGLRGACYRSSGLLCLYLFLMMLWIVCLSCYTMFAFAMSNQGAGKGYQEYSFNDHAEWLKLTDIDNWSATKSCLAVTKFCSSFGKQNLEEFMNSAETSTVEAGCCMPPDDCKFTYVQPTVWQNDNENANFSNPDCHKWNNNPDIMCYDCLSCQAGLLSQVKDQWKMEAEINTVILGVLVVVFIIGCCASGDKSSSMDAAHMQNPYLQDPYAPHAYAQNPYPPNPYAQKPYPPNPYAQNPYPPNAYAYKHLHP